MTPTYEVIPLDTYGKNLLDFDRSNQQRIRDSVTDWLGYEPQRYQMLQGAIRVAGRKFFGLRHIKIGVVGNKGGAYVLYRICEECLKNEYWKKSGVSCEFCDSSKPKRVVLFDVQPRSFDYGR